MELQPTRPHDRIAGLDGLRGLAVALVLGFHLYPRLVPGGWLGVSLFFTLSGFLITTVILRDRDNNTFAFTSFYARRARRLLPAAFLVLALFTISWTLLGWFNTDHRSDVFFSMLQIANWQQIWEGIPYGTALASPVVHYWSLAIEEQAYLVLPLLIVIAGRRRLNIVAGVLFIASITATFLADANQSVIYFGTHTRAAEILAGVIVAGVVHNTQKTPHRIVSTVITTFGLIYLITASLLVHLGDDIVYSGGLIVTGVISAAVIATVPHTPLSTFLNLRPLVWLGTVSYGIYLIHWPVLQTLKRTDLPQWATSPLTLVITVTAAQAMYRNFELPIRQKQHRLRVPQLFTALLTVTVVCFSFSNPAPKDFQALQEQTNNSVPSSTSNVPASSNSPSVFYFGDSKMMAYFAGIQNYVKDLSSDQRRGILFSQAGSFTRYGCPIGRDGLVRHLAKESSVSEGCHWPSQDNQQEPADIAVVWSGTWDVEGRKLPELFGENWKNISEADYRKWLLAEYEQLFEHLRTQHRVKLIAVVNFLGQSMSQYHNDYTSFLETLDQRNDDVQLFDLVDYLKNRDTKEFFIDGSHVSIGEPTDYSTGSDNSAKDLYTMWFEPQLCNAFQGKVTGLLENVTCPVVDNSPRQKN